MLAIVRFLVIIVAFLVINLIVLAFCVLRPFHRNNVSFAGRMYSMMAPILGIKIVIRQSDAIKPSESYVFIANHQNSYDIITICKAALPGVVTVGKKSLKWIPIFGQIYWLSGNILIDRKNSGRARDTLMAAAKKIKQKRTSVWLFPEGTRSNGRGLLPFKQGAFLIAKVTEEPIVMVTASNLHKKIRWNRWDNGVVLIELDAPQAMTKDHSLKGWMDEFHNRMAEKIKQLDAQVAEMEKNG